jgi:hypothetical protein
MRLQMVKPLLVERLPVSITPGTEKATESDSFAAQLPERVSTVQEKDADVVNLAFVGSRGQLQSAFQSAGWAGSDKLSKSSFMREFGAFLAQGSYTTAPMRPMLLKGVPADMMWQRSLNTYSKRDHLRIWRSSTASGTTIWVGSATHDNGTALSLRYKRLVHNIDPDIDEERAKVVRDLKMAGCVQSVRLVERPGVSHDLLNANGDPMKTDGRVALILLKDCSEASQTTTAKFKPGNKAFRYLRRQVLTFRSDIWRANIIYGTYDLVRMLEHAVRDKEKTSVAQREARAIHEMATTNPSIAKTPAPDDGDSEPTECSEDVQ